MKTREIEAKSIIRKYKKIDSWFISQWGLNVYRGCSHNCSYCDGRSEKYGTHENLGQMVEIKKNIIDILKRELDPQKKRKPLPKSFITISGGVCDAYQPSELKYRFTEKTLRLIHHFGYPVHIITKSHYVLRDLEILKAINQISRVIVSFSFSSANEDLSAIFEPGAPPPRKRLEAMKILNENGISSGMLLLPVVPFITDTRREIAKSLREGKKAGAKYILFGNMTLREGRQKIHFIETIKEMFPDYVQFYQKTYSNSGQIGNPDMNYILEVHETYNQEAKKLNIKRRIPLNIFNAILSLKELLIVCLEQLDYLLWLEKKPNSFGIAARSIANADDINKMDDDFFLRLKGVGPFTLSLIREIRNHKKSEYYNKIINS